jgi:hypothetical protein
VQRDPNGGFVGGSSRVWVGLRRVIAAFWWVSAWLDALRDGRPDEAARQSTARRVSDPGTVPRPMRPFGIPLDLPQVVISRALSDLSAIARAARATPDQLERLLTLGEEISATGRGVLELAETLDGRMERVLELGVNLDRRAAELLELGVRVQELGERIDARGAEIVDRASGVVETGAELIAVLPTLERALEMATPLEGAIDRFGRLVDRLPGGATRRRAGTERSGD